MNVLDRYILKHFLINFLILFAVLFLFTCMIQLFVNLERFVEAAERMESGATVGGLGRIVAITWMILDYFGPQVFQFYAHLVGLITVGAMGFTLVQLARHRELTAVLAVGVSLHRIAMPIIVAGLALNLLQFANRELVLPRVAPQLLRSFKDLGREQHPSFRLRMVADGQDRVFYAIRYLSDEQRMERLVVYEFDEQGLLGRRITADSGTWAGDARWMLLNGQARRVSAKDDARASRVESIEFIETDLDPSALLLRQYDEYRQMLSLTQIAELIDRPQIHSPEDLAQLIRIRYGRFAQILINMLTLLITLPFFLIRAPMNLLVQTVKCCSLGLGCQIGGAIGTAVGLPGVPTVASVFLFPLLIMMPLAVAMMGRVRT